MPYKSVVQTWNFTDKFVNKINNVDKEWVSQHFQLQTKDRIDNIKPKDALILDYHCYFTDRWTKQVKRKKQREGEKKSLLTAKAKAFTYDLS